MSADGRPKDPPRPQTPYDFNLLKTFRYEDVPSGRPPATHIERSNRSPATSETTPLEDLVATSRTSPASHAEDPQSHVSSEVKDDPATPPSNEAATAPTGQHSPTASHVPGLPTIIVHDESPSPESKRSKSPFVRRRTKRYSEDPKDFERIKSFHGISMDIPTGTFDDFTSPDHLQFSNRGTMVLDGEKMNKLLAEQAQMGGKTDKAQPKQMQGLRSGKRNPTAKMLQAAIQRERVLSAEEETFSARVRSMYEHGDENAAKWTNGKDGQESRSVTPETSDRGERSNVQSPDSDTGLLEISKSRSPQTSGHLRPVSPYDPRVSYISRDPTEVAGGIEDWEDISGRDVDRYGFINQDAPASRASSKNSVQPSPEQRPAIHRVSSSLQLLANSPRRRRTIRGGASNARSSRAGTSKQRDDNSVQARGSLHSFRSNNNSIFEARPFRSRTRRLMDEASDMLTLPPGLAAIEEAEDAGRTATTQKRREWAREEKWRKMARTVNRSGKGPRGGGMDFEFDTKDPRVIARTWKGIPDRWRATAWHSFLSTSARRRGGFQSDDELIVRFGELQDESSADDVQIDLDVPRTISMHVMFRRRYRGGQRLLFRVLHAISLHFPDTGYVQGMASLAATLLCYYDEERAFVMLVRLWQLRGLETLYRSGFDGLMAALDEFETVWLAGGGSDGLGAVATKLKELGISSTAYGTRWYLTLFNMSIPFPAQLRVWDVFMLLGDDLTTPRYTVASNQAPSSPPTPAHNTPDHPEKEAAAAAAKKKEKVTFAGADLDVLHATSAALVDATRDIILDSDFENAMKVLTSWVPVKDEDLLMRVAKAEWKAKKKRTKLR